MRATSLQDDTATFQGEIGTNPVVETQNFASLQTKPTHVPVSDPILSDTLPEPPSVTKTIVIRDTVTVHDTLYVCDTINIGEYIRNQTFEQLFGGAEYTDIPSLPDSLRTKYEQAVTFSEKFVLNNRDQNDLSMDSIKKIISAGLIVLAMNGVAPAQTDSIGIFQGGSSPTIIPMAMLFFYMYMKSHRISCISSNLHRKTNQPTDIAGIIQQITLPI